MEVLKARDYNHLRFTLACVPESIQSWRHRFPEPVCVSSNHSWKGKRQKQLEAVISVVSYLSEKAYASIRIQVGKRETFLRVRCISIGRKEEGMEYAYALLCSELS